MPAMPCDPAYDERIETALDPELRRVLVLGATGTIGRAVLSALLDAGLDVTCVLRHAPPPDGGFDHPRLKVEVGDLSSEVFLQGTLQGAHAVISCLASRSGTPADAWAVDHGLNSKALHACKRKGVTQFVLLSAICVQQPKLAFQHAKLAFEKELIASGLTYSIVRPTAFFKSLSGQLRRVSEGKPFLVFGDGELTACKPISDADLAQFMLRCLKEPTCRNRILPVGGPGPAITPLNQGKLLFQAMGKEPKFRNVPVGMMSGIIGLLSFAGTISASARKKAELARIGRYYATESMLLWNEESQAYDADATPEFGRDTLAEHYNRLVRGECNVELGEHAVF